MIKHTFLATAAITLAASTALANELSDAAQQLCETVKQCTLAELSDTQMTPEMRQMMEPMINGMCDAMRAGVADVPSEHELYQPAVDCMRSMAELECDDFQNEASMQTPACETYRERAEALAGQ